MLKNVLGRELVVQKEDRQEGASPEHIDIHASLASEHLLEGKRGTTDPLVLEV
jgi:hypothetical protein